jgi:hypothetical protein
MGRPRLSALVASVALAALGPRSAQAQAWTPPKGEASLTIGLASSFADQHLDDHGNELLLPSGSGWGSMRWNDADTDLSYGITDRLAVRVALPFVVSRYEGGAPHPPLEGHQNLDDGSWHSAFGDFHIEARFRATHGPLVVTPLVAFSVPSHSYEIYAHATAGLGLTEGQVGVHVGRLLDPVIPNSYMQVRYTFTMPGKALGISHDWSNIYLDAGYFVTSALTVSVIGEWQKTHGGWRVVDVPPPTDPNFLYHDQLLRADHLRLGGGVSYAITGALEVGLTAYGTLHASRDMNLAGVTLDMTYNFSPSQLAKKRKTPTGRPGKPS